jgi:glycosyltransferase involved in cell wall biosynthesis
MVKNAAAMWASNPDTFNLMKKMDASHVYSTLDAALPSSFFPEVFIPKSNQKQVLNLLWVGRFMPRKGSLLLLEVMEQLVDYPGITLTMIGDGEQRDFFLESVKEKNLEDKVFLKGKIPFEEVKKYYQSHDVFFFTSLRDSCPAQLIEAMAFGMPVVTLNLHGQAIIVSDQTGFRCSCDSPEQTIKELKNAILTLYGNSELLTSMSHAAHNFALKQSWDNKIKAIVSQCYPE